MKMLLLGLTAFGSSPALATNDCSDEQTARKYCVQAVLDAPVSGSINLKEVRIALIQKVDKGLARPAFKEVNCMFFAKLDNNEFSDSVLGSIVFDKNCKIKDDSNVLSLGSKLE